VAASLTASETAIIHVSSSNDAGKLCGEDTEATTSEMTAAKKQSDFAKRRLDADGRLGIIAIKSNYEKQSTRRSWRWDALTRFYKDLAR
jgi:hypothetical protein